MSNNANTLNLQLLDRNFHIKCKIEQVEKLQEAAAHLDNKMREIHESGNSIGYEKTALLAAIDICYELMVMRDAKVSLDDEVYTRMVNLYNKVEKTIEDSGITITRRAVGEQQTLDL